MDRLKHHSEIVERVFRKYAEHSPSQDELTTSLIVSRDNREFLLVTLGWGSHRRVPDVFGHVRLQDGSKLAKRRNLSLRTLPRYNRASSSTPARL
ncbi:MAG: element excision factor XisI family protein [Planctomycetota bacterium]|nr:element excision factor XisI family protein [Planctomycetota bacterium]